MMSKFIDTAMRLPAILLSFLLVSGAIEANPAAVQLLDDSGFENTSPGKLESSVSGKGWEVQRIGRPQIQDHLIAECIRDKELAYKGNHVVKMSLPKETVGFEFVTAGQRLELKTDREYEASVWVRWPDGPEKAPSVADAAPGNPSAIVSFWVRHKDAAGDFAGRDVWLFDREWKKLMFRFCASDSGQKSLIYVSLLPNQTPCETTVLVDDFTLNEIPLKESTDMPTKQVVIDGDFSRQNIGAIESGVWSFTHIGGASIRGNVIEQENEKFIRISMDKNTSNYESAQLSQMVNLKKGIRYEIMCRMRWDTYQESPTTPIVNYGFYHEQSNTWYGPIDQYLKNSKDWQTCKFVHIPPCDGNWKLYVQLNGWGNFGNHLTVSFDDFSCQPIQ